MIMDFILFLLTVRGKKIAKSCYSVHSSMRASNIISPEGKVKGSLSGYLLKVRAQEVTNNIFLSLRFHDIAKYILEFLLRNLIIVSANSNRSSLASKYDILMTVVPTIA